MFMALTHRLQLLLEEEQYQRLAHRAKSQGCSVGALIRQAIHLAWTEPDVARRQAAESILGAEPMRVPDPADLREEIANAHTGRFE